MPKNASTDLKSATFTEIVSRRAPKLSQRRIRSSSMTATTGWSLSFMVHLQWVSWIGKLLQMEHLGFTEICQPSWASIIERQIAKPIPVPLCFGREEHVSKRRSITVESNPTQGVGWN